jgi:hypothetical protein
MLPVDIIKIISGYACAYSLKKWVDKKNLDKGGLSGNLDAIHILEKNLDKVDWWSLSGNPAAIHILEKNLHNVNWNWLSAILLLSTYWRRIWIR